MGLVPEIKLRRTVLTLLKRKIYCITRRTQVQKNVVLGSTSIQEVEVAVEASGMVRLRPSRRLPSSDPVTSPSPAASEACRKDG